MNLACEMHFVSRGDGRLIASFDDTFRHRFEAADGFLALPSIVIVFVVTAFWALVSYAIHRCIVPLLCGADGRKLGKFEAEVTSPIAVAFGLLISFNAVWIWDRAERVRCAVVDEGVALTAVVTDAEMMADRVARDAICASVAAYATYLIDVEWPMLTDSSAQRTRPLEFRELTRLVRASGEEHMRNALNDAETARDVRVRDGLIHMAPSRWSVVLLLAVLLLISIGALHGDGPRGRLLALTLVTLAVSVCFSVLLLHARPFIGEMALQPDDLREVVFRAKSES